MSLQDAKRFVEETAADIKLTEQIKAVGIEAEESSVTFFARAAKGFGYDFTAEELEEAMRAKQEAGSELVDGSELVPGELESVAGGGSCFYDNSCSHVFNWQKGNPSCKSTHRGNSELCYASDYCDSVIKRY